MGKFSSKLNGEIVVVIGSSSSSSSLRKSNQAEFSRFGRLWVNWVDDSSLSKKNDVKKLAIDEKNRVIKFEGVFEVRFWSSRSSS